LSSSQPIFKSIVFLRNQDKKKDYYGEELAFLHDQKYLSLKEVGQEIGDIKLLLE
jgi:hypothetical protein